MIYFTNDYLSLNGLMEFLFDDIFKNIITRKQKNLMHFFLFRVG